MRWLSKTTVVAALAVVLPLGGAIGYMQWTSDRKQAAKDAYDAAHALTFTIPAGTSRTVASIQEQAVDLPDVITMTLGLSDTLRIHNADSAPGRVGPFKVDPGLTYRQQFQTPGRFPFVCDIDKDDSLTVVVLPRP